MTINYSDQEVITGQKSIFLAGPTPRDPKIESWRIDACKILEENGFDGVVYVPEYSSWHPLENYLDQTEWKEKRYPMHQLFYFGYQDNYQICQHLQQM